MPIFRQLNEKVYRYIYFICEKQQIPVRGQILPPLQQKKIETCICEKNAHPSKYEQPFELLAQDRSLTTQHLTSVTHATRYA